MAFHYLNREQSRKIDAIAIAEYGIPGLLLMENAARGCVDRLVELGISGLVVICCGSGNNAGDGLAMARHLELRGYQARVVLCADPARFRGDAATNFAILQKTEVPLVRLPAEPAADWWQREVTAADWLVDAILGTGSQGPPRAPLSSIIRLINETKARRMAVDLPSGLDGDTGEPAEPTVRADHTCTFVAAKLGFANPAAAPFLGQVHILDIGAPRQILEKVLRDGQR